MHYPTWREYVQYIQDSALYKTN